MNEMQKIPDQKLKTGAIMAMVTNIIGIIWSIIITILVLTAISLFKIPEESLDTVATTFKVIMVIFALIGIAVNITIVLLAKNVLQGKAKSGLVVGIITLVLGGLGLMASFYNFSPLSIVSLITSGVDIAAGILLIMGKYLPENNNQTDLLPQS